MEKLIMLGTGHGSVMSSYNTCFILENNNERLLVDTGGSIDIIKNLYKKGYNLSDIQNIFISHCHTDHILGLIWILKKAMVKYITGEYKKIINIYGNLEVVNSLKNLFKAVLPDSLIKAIDKNVVIHVVHNEEKLEIVGEKITFFDAKAKGNLLYGFETTLNNGKKLIFLGDETCNPILYGRLKGADYVMHEAFCLNSEENIPAIIKEHHSTVKSVCETMQPLNIKNLIIYHTEDSHDDKKDLYTQEAKKYFSNNIMVPDDLDEIIL